MERHYTDFNRNSTKKYASMDVDKEVVDFFQDPESFRSFDKGLKESLINKGFAGESANAYELADCLIARLQAIGSSLKRDTVISWLVEKPGRTHKPRPKIEAGSRSTIYEICFALDFTIEETVWFFEHVYYDRPFNCHTIEEAVYYFAFLHHIGYQEALSLIQEVKNTSSDSVNSESESASNSQYTWFVQNQIELFSSIEELKAFLITNKEEFQTWNQSALKVLNTLRLHLIGPPESEQNIQRLKKQLTPSRKHPLIINPADYPHCGLLFKQIFYDAQKNFENTGESLASYIWQRIHNKSVRSNDFLLEQLLLEHTGLGKRKQIPYIVRNNFPNKKTFADVLSSEKMATSKSYDAIRKAMILLDFFCFWIPVTLKESTPDWNKKDLADIYRDEANNRLYQCGYHPLYDGNPYDWIFLCSAQSDNPIEYFKDCISELLSSF